MKKHRLIKRGSGISVPDRSMPEQERCADPKVQHRLHHDRRPHGSNDELLRFALCRNAQSRPHRQRRRAIHEQLRSQLTERPSRACMLTGKHSCANKFYDNTTCVFDSSQQTFPKLLQKAGYQTAVIGKWHLESLPSGFDYWEVVPGQGSYYNPDFITQDNDTIQKHGYITNLITDDAIDWMENKRDKDRPFCLLIHHKAIHRNWMADTCNLALYEDKTFPLPDNFYDDYEGRPAAAAQEMSIVKDMDLIYDLKMLRPDKNSILKATYESFLGRMDKAQRAAWDKFYDPIIKDFYKQNLSGKELANWKYQRYMRDYMKTVKSLDDNVGRVLDYLEKKRTAGKHVGCLHFRPRVLYGRARMVRQTLHV